MTFFPCLSRRDKVTAYNFNFKVNKNSIKRQHQLCHQIFAQYVGIVVLNIQESLERDLHGLSLQSFFVVDVVAIFAIVSGNIPLSVALHQNHASVFIEMLESNINSKFQYAKTKWNYPV